MPRIARNKLNTPYLHVMVQGVNKEYIFNENENIKKYLTLINKYKRKYKFTIMAYCIMNNHAHILVYTEDIKSFSKFMQKINLIYAQIYNKENKRCGVLFRNRYQTEPIYEEKHLINCIKYIHNNPVKAGMVSECGEYKYSSYNDYIYNKGIAESEIIKKVFGTNCDFKSIFKETYEKRFMDAGEKRTHHSNEYILEGIREYKHKTKNQIIDVLQNKSVLKEMIDFLMNECGIRCNEIQSFFEMSRRTMENVKK